MPIKTYRPTTPTRRFATVVSREDITKDRPEKSLVESKKLVVASRIDAVRAARAREDATFAYMVGAAANASALGAFLEAGRTP